MVDFDEGADVFQMVTVVIVTLFLYSQAEYSFSCFVMSCDLLIKGEGACEFTACGVKLVWIMMRFV